MSQFGFGIVGTGMLAGAVADSLAKARNTNLLAVAGRRIETSQRFVATREEVDAVAVEGFAALLARDDLQAVYIATPTSAKEEIALAALNAGKHVLIEKPFMSLASVERMCNEAAQRKLLIMDATPFVHHPRTSIISIGTPEKIGVAKSLHTSFSCPSLDRDNISFDVTKEPMGALGVMGWYSMRAIVEYLQPEGPIKNVGAVADRDCETSAVVRAEGMIEFASGETSTFEVGYTTGAVTMDLLLFGTEGAISIDDFVRDCDNNREFKSSNGKTGFTHKSFTSTPEAPRGVTTFVPTPTKMPPEVIMLERFVEVATYRDTREMDRYAEATLKTQEYLDATWAATNKACAS